MTFRRDTGPAKLPGIPKINITDPALSSWVNAVTEWIEVRNGSRGNDSERAVTVRELQAVSGAVTILQREKSAGAGEVVVSLGNGLSAVLNVQAFADALRSTQLYRDLLKRLDDPSRFDDVAASIRTTLLRSIAQEAAIRGAEIRRAETITQDVANSIAAAVEEVTAALGLNTTGIRDTMGAWATQSAAGAVRITQLETSLGNYYQDGTPGRVALEQQLTTFADQTAGLRAQYTLKVTAGGALAGFGVAATEVNGVPSSAFIISADKFAIVSPSYDGGLTNNPNANHVPFGVDGQGIYLNSNVYIKGSTIIDTPRGGRPVESGMRGSLNLSVSGSSWSDTAARQAVWSALGNAGAPPSNAHLVIGDTVTISGAGSPPSFIDTRYWGGDSWLAPGVVINGNLLVDGSVAAQKIDTRGLTVRDASGNIILSSGVNLDYSRVDGGPAVDATRNRIFKQPTAPLSPQSNDIWWNTATNQIFFWNGSWQIGADSTANNIAAGIAGQGAFATLNTITAANSGTFIADLAIGRLKLMRYAANFSSVTMTDGVAQGNVLHGLGQQPIAWSIAWSHPEAGGLANFREKSLYVDFITGTHIGFSLRAFDASGQGFSGTATVFWTVI